MDISETLRLFACKFYDEFIDLLFLMGDPATIGKSVDCLLTLGDLGNVLALFYFLGDDKGAYLVG